MVQEGTHNLNVTVKGYPKKFCCLFGQKAHKTQQITLFHPKRRFILNLNKPQTDLQPKMQTQLITQWNSEFIWDGSAHSAHNTATISDWLIFQNGAFSLVMVLTLITQSLYDFSQPDCHHTHPSHTYITENAPKGHFQGSLLLL